MKTFDVIVERDSKGYFIGTVPSLPGCHTQAQSLDELEKRIGEAIELCLREPESVDASDYVGSLRVTVNV